VQTPLLAITDLWAGYEETPIVRGIDLTIQAGETVVLIGPNGHGKTTLLRTISGLIRAYHGEIRLAGRLITGRSPEELTADGLIHIPQGDALFPDLLVEENLLMGAYPPPAWRRRHESLEHVYKLFPQLQRRARQLARTLSGGERRQLSIGRGLMRPATLLLIDEPSLGLAPVLVDSLYDVIEEIAKSSTTVLLVEENFKHIRRLAKRVCVLEMGRIVRTGTLDELLNDPVVAESYLGVVRGPKNGR
jgi:branched-chain amino acid transport system ATP-binding protein